MFWKQRKTLKNLQVFAVPLSRFLAINRFADRVIFRNRVHGHLQASQVIGRSDSVDLGRSIGEEAQSDVVGRVELKVKVLPSRAQRFASTSNARLATQSSIVSGNSSGGREL